MTARSSRRILIVGTDGLRPDQFDPDLMPTFAKLAAEGTRIEQYHAVYPTHTRVNLTTLATGCTPGKHGIIANVFQQDGATEDGVINTGDYRHLQALDDFCNGDGISVPTLGDIIDARGKRLAIASTSTSGAGIIWNRNFPYRVVNTNSAYGRADLYSLRDKLGEVPEPGTPPKLDHVNYAARAVTDIFLDDEEIEVIVLWLAEPDSSLHYYGVAAPETKTALKGCDDALAHVLDGMERRRIRDQFDIIHLSDHGHSTVLARRTLAEHLDRARQRLPGLPPMITASDYIYADPNQRKPVPEEICWLISWLQDQPWAGVILAQDSIAVQNAGVFPLSAVWGEPVSERAPMLAVSPAWSDLSNDFGAPGMVAAMTEHAALRSTHGSASPYELHAVASFNGPDFTSGVVSELPAGAIDIAPTILSLLGADVPDHMDGRVLWEVMARPEGNPGDVSEIALEPDRRAGNGFSPVLQFHQVGEQRYLHQSLNGFDGDI
jgi:predicted AlkP superfamily pyrophosphatase or phosphodiesterase